MISLNGRIRSGFWLAGILFLASVVSPLQAAEKGGLLVDISKSVVEKADGPARPGHSVSVHRTMALKLEIKNNSMKEVAPTTIEYIALVERPSSSSGTVKRYKGTAQLEALPVSSGTTVFLGNIPIRGHQHVNSDERVDHLVAWKVIINQDGQKLEFESGSNFSALNNGAKDRDQVEPES